MLIYSIVIVFSCLIVYINGAQTATHFRRAGNRIKRIEDSIFQLRNPGDLCAFLKQEELYNKFLDTSVELLELKKTIRNDEENEMETEAIEKKVYDTNSYCRFAGKPLFKFDLYVGAAVFAYQKYNYHISRMFKKIPVKQNDLLYPFDDSDYILLSSTDTCSRNSSFTLQPADVLQCGKSAPNYSDTLDEFYILDKEKHQIEYTSTSSVYREDCILESLGLKVRLEDFEDYLYDALQMRDPEWNTFLLGSFYWRYFGDPIKAMACIIRAYEVADQQFRPIVMLSAATILHRADEIEDAADVLAKILETDEENPFAHYQLANIFSIFGRSKIAIQQFDRILGISPNFLEAKLRRAAHLCNEAIETALNAQQETLKNTLTNLKEFNAKSEVAEELLNSMLSQQAFHHHKAKLRGECRNSGEQKCSKK